VRQCHPLASHRISPQRTTAFPDGLTVWQRQHNFSRIDEEELVNETLVAVVAYFRPSFRPCRFLQTQWQNIAADIFFKKSANLIVPQKRLTIFSRKHGDTFLDQVNGWVATALGPDGIAKAQADCDAAIAAQQAPDLPVTPPLPWNIPTPAPEPVPPGV
jgi:hypothetical protein